jgi:hypothetical protein
MRDLLARGLVALVAAAVLLASAAGEAQSPGAGPGQARPNAFPELRRKALMIQRVEVGLPAPARPTDPWGVIMEMGYPDATVTVVAFSDGAASIYLSSGGGFIGGGEHEAIRRAAQELVRTAARFQPGMTPTSTFPEPQRGQTFFYLRTDQGVYAAAAPQRDLGERRHPLSPLFLAAQDVITQYRLLEGKGR